MLAAIGIIIVLKQIPHAFGHDSDFEGDENFLQPDGENTFTAFSSMMNSISEGAITLSIISLGILILWEKVLSKKHRVFQLVPGPLVAVVVGLIFQGFIPESSIFFIQASHLVNVPVPENLDMFIGQFTLPNFGAITSVEVWTVAVTLAVVASLETLLSVEATDKLDSEKKSDPNQSRAICTRNGKYPFRSDRRYSCYSGDCEIFCQRPIWSKDQTFHDFSWFVAFVIHYLDSKFAKQDSFGCFGCGVVDGRL